MMKNYRFIISGRVQGVYYRANIKKSAHSSGFNGYVKNLSNGSVEACVTCEEVELSKFNSILKKGSMLSNVTDIKQLECDEIFDNGFEVR